MDDSLISVIVPVFNTETYLAACLDSILSQSYRRLEVIVINDGSTDFSLNIAEKYAEQDDRVKVYSFENSGLSQARNHGLDLATGHYITFVDSDDLLLPDALEVMYNYICMPDIDMVEGDTVKGKIVGTYNYSKQCKKEIYTPKDAISHILYQNKLLPSVCGKLYKAELFSELRFEKGILYEDLNIFYHILERCNKILKIEFPVYFYRETEGSILNSWKPQRLDVLKVTEKIEDYIHEKYPDLILAAKDRRLSANFNMFALCTINGDKENADKCWQHIRENRRNSLFNPRVRIKNKSGIIASYMGKNFFKFVSRIKYK